MKLGLNDAEKHDLIERPSPCNAASRPFLRKESAYDRQFLEVARMTIVGSALLACSADAQTRSRPTTPQSVQQRYGIQGA
jgi:hypothetical protein